MIIFGISFLDQTGNFLLSSYFFKKKVGERGGAEAFFLIFFWGGGEGGVGKYCPLKKYNNHVFLSIGSFFFPYLVQLMVTIYHFPCIVYLK